jgi:prepilin-type N-terminal cleavage/methylation domain-containing protein
MNHNGTNRWFGGRGKSRRGMTLIELVVGIVIVGTAAIGTSIAVFNAYGQLQRQRHRMIANQHMRAEIEFWQGRIHTAFPTTQQMNNAIERSVMIDERESGDRFDDITGTVRRQPIRTHTMVSTSTQLQYYWEIPVSIKYTEPTWVFGDSDVEVEYHLVGYWIEAEPTNRLGDD